MICSSFVSIDFETMTASLTSACSVGMVKVVDGNIYQKYYSLIKPIPDERTHYNTDIHGITTDMVANAPTFAQIYPFLKSFLEGFAIVCHNRGADINIMRECMDYYGLEGLDLDNNYCTYEMTGLSLDACSSKFGIDMGVHHDALDDALVCAKVFLACQGKIVTSVYRGGIALAMQQQLAKKIEHDVLMPLSGDLVVNKETPFFQAKVVITGTFVAYPNRNELASLLKKLGADINTSVSPKTNIVVMGQGAGPAKIKKIEELRANGKDIRIIFEEELKHILNYGEG